MYSAPKGPYRKRAPNKARGKANHLFIGIFGSLYKFIPFLARSEKGGQHYILVAKGDVALMKV